VNASYFFLFALIPMVILLFLVVQIMVVWNEFFAHLEGMLSSGEPISETDTTWIYGQQTGRQLIPGQNSENT